VGPRAGLYAVDKMKIPAHHIWLMQPWSQYGREVFEDRIISRGLWPPRSSDLSFCDVHLRGNLKGEAFKNNPRSIEALQTEITRVIGSIAVDGLQKVPRSLFMRCEACLQAEGGHFQHLL
jgi:hypothetical protein